MEDLSPKELREILKNHPGIYEVSQQQLDEESLEATLKDEEKRLNIAFNTVSINIDLLKNNISNFQNEKPISHLSILYAIDTNIVPLELMLIFRGVQFDETENGNPSLKIKPEKIASNQFNSKNHQLFSDTELSHLQTIAYKSKVATFYNSRKIIQGMYLRISDLLEKLEMFKNEGADKFQISFGFMFAKKAGDWNCLQLIFKGLNSVSNQFTEKIFSTYNHLEKGESGAKPTKPPFDQ